MGIHLIGEAIECTACWAFSSTCGGKGLGAPPSLVQGQCLAVSVMSMNKLLLFSLTVLVAVAALLYVIEWPSSGKSSRAVSETLRADRDVDLTEPHPPVSLQVPERVAPIGEDEKAPAPPHEQDSSSEGKRLTRNEETLSRLRAEGYTEAQLAMMFIPAKLHRYREMFEYHRAMGDVNALEAAIHGALSSAIAAQLELQGGQEGFREMELRDLMQQGLEVFTLNGKRYAFESRRFPPWDHFKLLRTGQANDTTLAAQWFYDELGQLLDETSAAALKYSGGRTLDYQHPWQPN